VADGLPPRSLSAAYEARLDALRARAGAAADTAFRRFLRHRSWSRLSDDLVAVWTAAQVAGAQAGDLYVAGAVLANTGALPGATPSPVPLGVTSGGSSLREVADATARVVEARMQAGATFDDALAASHDYLAGSIRGEAHRVARVSVIRSPASGVVGWQRVAEPDACRFCRMLATRGPVYRTAETASMTARGVRYHRNCRCRIVPVTSVSTREGLIRAGQAEWSRMLATGDVPRMARHLIAPDVLRRRAAALAA
jgi:hypothetical protein